MTFLVRYRGRDGALYADSVDAPNRTDCVAECKRRGISPIEIRERENRKSPSPKKDKDASGNWKFAFSKKSLTVVIAALVVVIGSSWWLVNLKPGGDKIPSQTNVDVAPPVQHVVKSPKAHVQDEQPKMEPRKVVPKGTPISERRVPKTYRDKHGVLRYEGGARAPDPTRTYHVAKRMSDPINDSIFKTRPENEIAMLLTAVPGDTILSVRRYDESFEAEFMKSLENNVEVVEEDTPEHAELKRAMIETKKEIAERVRKGERLADILEETRSELRRLADYRRNLEKAVSDAARNPEMAKQDVADYLAAANKMLAENGLKPIKSGIIRKNLMLRAKQQQKQETPK